MTIYPTKYVPNEQVRERMTFIDGLRAIAALMVILPHSYGIWDYNSSSDFLSTFMKGYGSYGRLGVPIFFVISGFAIAYSTRQAKFTPTWFRYFFLKRFIRLSPTYYFSILVVVLMTLLQRYFGRNALASLPSPLQLFTNLLYLQNFFSYENINPVFWTICIEIQLYIFYGLLMLALNFIFRRWLSKISNGIAWSFIFISLLSFTRPIVLIGNATGVRIASGTGIENYVVFLPYWFMFSTGVIVWWGIEGVINRNVVWVFIAFFWLFTAITGEVEVMAATMTATLIYLCGVLNKLHIWLNFKPLQFLGLVSYSIYIIHVPVILFTLAIQNRLSRGGYFENFFFFLVVILLTIGAAITMYYLVELPSIQRARKLN
jgi:peptidoglycan/LPS O-acetylase OafA/YrhL